MTHAHGLAAAVVVCCGLAAAAAEPRFTSTWAAPDAAQTSFFGKKVAALVITTDDNLRISAEEELARLLSARGAQAVPTYRMAPKEELTSAERAKPWFERAGIEGVVTLRPIAMDTQTVAAQIVTTNYSTFWGAYGTGWTTVYEFGGPRKETTLVVETLVHSVPLNKLLWAGVSTTTNPKEAQAFIKDLVEETVSEMRKGKLIQ